MNKYDDLISQMTWQEKCSFLSGKNFWATKGLDRLGVPESVMTDGPHGLRKEKASAATNVMKESEPATCFPTAATTACSWDVDLLKEIGAAIANEAIHYGVNTVLGPGVNIKRSPLCGRNFEYFSEDPYLAGELGAAYVNGAQSRGVGTSLKHYAANNQETRRLTIESKVDERTLREIYLTAFEKVVKQAQPATVMCSYNKLNGEYLSDSKKMLTDVLRDEWGFKGIVVSDWGAVNDRIKGVSAGLDLEMPGNGGYNDRKVERALESYTLPEEDVNKCVARILDFNFKTTENAKLFANYKCDFDANHKLARRAASESAVLLKNNGALPVKKSDKIAVIGRLADKPRYQGSGSSRINPQRLPSFLNVLDSENVKYCHAPAYTFKKDGSDFKLLNEAVDIAKDVDKVLVFVGLTDSYESEGFDRSHLSMPASHLQLVEELAKVNRNVAVVLMGGAPVELPFINRISSLLNVYLGGEAVAEATYDLLYGNVCPSGKLAETFPLKNSDSLSHLHFPMGPRSVEYREAIYVGYRYFDAAGVPVQFPFGFGLSYTSFEYSDFRLDKSSIKEGDSLTCTFKIKNIGSCAGAETAQIYVSDKEHTLFTAEKELKGFKKVYLAAGEEKEVQIVLDARAFQFYNVNEKDWCVESGDFAVLLAASSRDIKQSLTVFVETAHPDMTIPDYRDTAPAYYNIREAGDILQGQFAALYGGTLDNNVPFVKGEFTLNSTIEDLTAVRLGRQLQRVLRFGAKIVGGSAANTEMILKSLDFMPIRGFSGFTGGIVPYAASEALVDVFNGKKGGWRKFFRGFKKENR